MGLLHAANIKHVCRRCDLFHLWQLWKKQKVFICVQNIYFFDKSWKSVDRQIETNMEWPNRYVIYR